MPLTIFWFMLFAAISSVFIFLPVSVSFIVSFVMIFIALVYVLAFYVIKQNFDKDISALIWALRNTPKE